MNGPTLEDLLACLGEQEAAAAEGYRTAAEWADSLEVTQVRMRTLMHQAAAKGKLMVRHEQRAAIDGRMARVPVYRFTLN